MRVHETARLPAGPTVTIRRPTAPPGLTEAAPTFRLEGPVTRPARGHPHRRGVAIVADSSPPTGSRACAADGVTSVTTVETHAQVGDTGAADRSHIADLADAVDFAIVGLGTCGSCTSFAIADAVTIERTSARSSRS